MDSFFARMILGHLAGDYLLQPRSMALNKSAKNTKGLLICFIHCVIYTFCVCVFVNNFQWDIVLLIFLSHFSCDFWSWGEKWLKLIRGRNISKAFNSQDKYHEIDLIFSCIVYTVVDNAIHLILMFFILK